MSADPITQLYQARFGSLGTRPVVAPASRAPVAVPPAPPPVPPHSEWTDATLVALSRDTRAWIRENPDGGEIGDWYDARPHTTLLYYLAKWINWPDPRAPRPAKPPLCLEIGVRHGVTTLALAQAMKEADGLLVSVEIDQKWADAAAKEIARAELGKWWNCSVTSSDEFFAAQDENCPLFDLIWIDGDHGEAQSRKDIENYSQLLRPGGIIACHDYYSLPWPCDPPICPPFPSFVSGPVEELRAARKPDGTPEWEVFVVPFAFGVALCRKL